MVEPIQERDTAAYKVGEIDSRFIPFLAAISKKYECIAEKISMVD